MSTKNFKTISVMLDKNKIDESSNLNFMNEDFYREKNKFKDSIILPRNDFALRDNNSNQPIIENTHPQLIRNNQTQKSSNNNTSLSNTTNISLIKNEKSKPKYKAENLREIDDRLRIRSDLVFPANSKRVIIQDPPKTEKKENMRTSSPFLEKVKNIMNKEGKTFSKKNLVQPVSNINKENTSSSSNTPMNLSENMFINMHMYKSSPTRNIGNLNFQNQSRTVDIKNNKKTNPRDKDKLNTNNDYFMQIFRNASSQNQNVKNLIDKVSKINQMQTEVIKNKYMNLPHHTNGQFHAGHSYEKDKNDLSMNVFERDISSSENIGKKFERNEKYQKNEKEKSLVMGNDSFLRYEANSEKEKDLYVQSLKKNLQEFSHRKHEVKKNREKVDMFEDLNEKIDNIVKKIHHEDQDIKFNRIDVDGDSDEVNQIGEKYMQTEKHKTFDSERNSPRLESIKIEEKVEKNIKNEKENLDQKIVPDKQGEIENGKNNSKVIENMEFESIKVYPNNQISNPSSKAQGIFFISY